MSRLSTTFVYSVDSNLTFKLCVDEIISGTGAYGVRVAPYVMMSQNAEGTSITYYYDQNFKIKFENDDNTGASLTFYLHIEAGKTYTKTFERCKISSKKALSSSDGYIYQMSSNTFGYHTINFLAYDIYDAYKAGAQMGYNLDRVLVNISKDNGVKSVKTTVTRTGADGTTFSSTSLLTASSRDVYYLIGDSVLVEAVAEQGYKIRDGSSVVETYSKTVSIFNGTVISIISKRLLSFHIMINKSWEQFQLKIGKNGEFVNGAIYIWQNGRWVEYS